MSMEVDSRLKDSNKVGETISLSELIQRWQNDKEFINKLCFAKKIRPYRDSREGVVSNLNGSEVYVFSKSSSRNEPCIIEDIPDCEKFEALPDDVYFYLTDVLSFEEAKPDVKKGKGYPLYFEIDELRRKSKAPLDRLDKEVQSKTTIANCVPTLSLQNFIDRLLAEAIGDNDPLPTFCKLVEEDGMVIHDKVIEGQIVSSSKLLFALREREQQADKSFDKNKFDIDFWGTLSKERKYSVFCDDVAKAYEHAGKSKFPWVSWDNKLIWLDVKEQAKAETVDNEPKKPITKLIEATPVFSKFKDLRPNEIALVMMDDKTAKMVIRGEKINICPQDLGLKTGSRGWKLLEGASMVSGDLTQVLRSINKTSDRAKEKNRIKKAVADLNKSIKNSMGLSTNPINYVNKSGYNFIFRSMTHQKLHGKNISKGNDAMDHIDYNGLSKREYSNFDEGYEAEAYHDNDEPDEDESVDCAGFWHDANE